MSARKGLTETQVWVPFAISLMAFGLGLTAGWVFGDDGRTVGVTFMVIGGAWLVLVAVYHIGKAVGRSD